MERFLDMPCDLKNVSPLSLAFVGDGVYDLLVREYLICETNSLAGVLHARAVERVRCEAQADAVSKILPLLSDEEETVLRRGRNACGSHTPKNATPAQYHLATGFEALLGYLYLNGQMERIRTLFQEIIKEQE